MTYSSIEKFLKKVKEKNPHQPEFIQAVKEVAESVIPFINDHKKYQNKALLERLVEPERIIQFRVPWVDDDGEIQINRGYRVEMNSAIGPYKGGLRFHPSVNVSVLKFLAFEQVFKNSLTTMPMGGGKGGSDFHSKGKSTGEIMRFCQSFMTELYRHIGHQTDVPAGDIGVGSREIGYLFGQYKRITNQFTGVLTGKKLSFGGSEVRTEATGYGLIYFLECMIKENNDSLKGKRVLISGAGNVAQYAVEKAIEKGAKVLTMSDSDGTIVCKGGITEDILSKVIDRKSDGGSLKDLAGEFSEVEFRQNKKPWTEKAEVALPCAMQNELEEDDAEQLLQNGCKYLAEGANMPCTTGAAELIEESSIMYAPGKACNAGGVATSGLEMAQNAMHIRWTRNEVDQRLQDIMKEIYHQCVEHGKEGEKINYVKGANIAGFVKVADAMLAQGVV